MSKSSRYLINPKFVPAPPTPATFFFHGPDPGTPEARQDVIRKTCEHWRAAGVQQVRATLTGPEVDGDESGYPAGIWLEGWTDRAATMLPFGSGYPDDNGPCYPPLVKAAVA